MPRWRLEYEIDLDETDGVTDHTSAAVAVYNILADPTSLRPYFSVVNVDTGVVATVDLEEEEGR